MKKDKTFRPDRVLSYFKAEWLPLAFVTLSGLVYNIGLLATPWFEGRLAQCLADILGGSETAAKMAMLVLAYIVVTLAVQAARFIKRFYVRRFANNINRRMKGILYANLVRQSRAALLLLEGTRTNQPMVKKYVRAARTGAVVLAVLVVYGNVCSAVIDQEAMYEGRKTLKSMSDHIADDLMSSGYFDDNEQLPVLFVGRPSSNSSFMKREYYLYANPYAQMGRFWLNDYSARASWKAVFRDITPAKLKHCSVEQYGELYSRTELEQMPVYPQEGYIQQIDGVVVVKISDDYKVDKEFAPLIDLGELFQLIMDDINDS